MSNILSVVKEEEKSRLIRDFSGINGESPSGKAAGFGPATRGFESYLPRIFPLNINISKI